MNLQILPYSALYFGVYSETWTLTLLFLSVDLPCTHKHTFDHMHLPAPPIDCQCQDVVLERQPLKMGIFFPGFGVVSLYCSTVCNKRSSNHE